MTEDERKAILQKRAAAVARSKLKKREQKQNQKQEEILLQKQLEC